MAGSREPSGQVPGRGVPVRTAAVRGGTQQRARRSFWIDPRLAIGLALVVASVAGVFAVISASDRTVRVYAASSALGAGDRAYPGDLDLRSVRLGDLEGRYLAEGDVPSDGVLITRSVAEGELVPASAVGTASSIRVASVVVSVSGQLPGSIHPATVVDMWAATETEDHSFGPPAVLVGSATVVRVFQPTGLIADGGGVSVEVLVPREKIARVLESVANKDALSLVPVSIPVKK